jgi:hypothetical protein
MDCSIPPLSDHGEAEAGLTKQRKSPVLGGRAFPDGKRGDWGAWASPSMDKVPAPGTVKY